MKSYQISRGHLDSVEATTDPDRFALIHTRATKRNVTIFNRAEARKLRDAINEWLEEGS